MKKVLFLVWGLFLVMTAAAADMSLKAYLQETKIKLFAVEEVDLTTGLEKISQLLNEGDSPRKVSFVLSPGVQKLSGRATMLLENIPAVTLLRFFLLAVKTKPASVKMMVLDRNRLAIALRGEPFPGVPQTARTVRGNFMRNSKVPFQTLKQIQAEIKLFYDIPLPDVKMSFLRKRNGKRTIGILKITGSDPEVRRTIRILSLFFGSSFDRFHAPSGMEHFKPFMRNDFY